MSRTLHAAVITALQAVLTISLSGRLLAQEAVPPPAAPGAAAQPAEDALQVLEQGPVHEAFAEPVALNPGAGIVVDKQPPEPINELPPDVRPEGNNVEWIPGYWMWSDQQQDFIWVSGVWRDIPPGRRWVPGHWTKADGGFAWTPGFWAGAQVQTVEMQPLPPESLEAGPNRPAPGDNYFWIPGCWLYRDSAYVWRAGYWYAGQPNWLWVPDHYCYTPYGAIFVNGYWDYPLASRGLLYAPVWWSRPIYARPGYYYRPYSVVNTALLLTALFVNDHHHHYYYGYGGWRNNYYRPWWQVGYGGRYNVYNPFYAYHRWHDGHNHHDWDDRVRRDFDRHQHDFADHHGRPGDGRPGHWDARPGQRPPNKVELRNRLVQSVDEVRRTNNLPVALRDVSPTEREAMQQRVQDFQRLKQSRRDALTHAGASGRARLDAGNDGPGGAGPDNQRGDGPRLADPGNRPLDRPGQIADANRPDARTAFRLPPVEKAISDRATAGLNHRGARHPATNPAARGDANALGNNAAQARSRNRASVVIPGAGADRLSPPELGSVGAGNLGSGAPQAQRQDGPRRIDLPGAAERVRQPAGQNNNVPRNLGLGRNGLYGGPGSSRSNPAQANAGSANAIPGASGNITARPQFRPSVRDLASPANPGLDRARTFERPMPSAGQAPQSFRGNSGNSGSPQRSFRGPSGGAERRSIQAPSGAQRSIQIPHGGGESRSMRVPAGGGSRPEVRGNFERGGGNSDAFRGGHGRGQRDR